MSQGAPNPVYQAPQYRPQEVQVLKQQQQYLPYQQPKYYQGSFSHNQPQQAVFQQRLY